MSHPPHNPNPNAPRNPGYGQNPHQMQNPGYYPQQGGHQPPPGPYQQYPPQNEYPPQHPPQYPPHGERPHSDERRRSRDGDGDTVANIIHVLTGVIVLIFVLHILFVLFGANQGNDFVSFVYGTAKVLVLGLGDVFTPGDAMLGVALNYGLAALVYLVIGRLISRSLRR